MGLALYVVTSHPETFEPELDAISFLHLRHSQSDVVGRGAPDVQPVFLFVAIALGALVVDATRRKSPAI